MIKNNLKIAIRTLTRNKLYTALNIAGLTFGISCFIIIGLYLFDELTFDQHHKCHEKIFRAIQHKTNKNETLQVAGSGYTFSDAAVKNIPEIEKVVRFNALNRSNISNPELNRVFLETHITANEEIFNVFDFEVLDGSLQGALDKPYHIVLVEDLALKLFRTSKVAGKTILFEWDQPFVISAVLKNLPKNSSLQFNALISEITLRNTDDFKEEVEDWKSDDFMTFFKLKEPTDAEATSQKLTRLLYDHAQFDPGSSISYGLQRLKDIHFTEDIEGNSTGVANGSMLYIKVFGVIALFVLLIACINYMNLSTSRASNRSKEIGIRKANGAFRTHLINQFLTESFVVTSASFLLSVLLVNAVLPIFNAFVDKRLTLDFNSDYRIWLMALSVLIVTGFVSGSYPAFMLSKFSPLNLLKSLKHQSKADLSLRKALVVFQFTISIVMIIATLLIYQQIKYVDSKDLGFDKELLCVVDINSGKVRRSGEVIKAEFSKIPNVTNVAITSRVPGEWKTIPTVKIKQKGDVSEHQNAYFLGVDEGFAETFDIKVIHGKGFTSKADSASILINETAAEMLGISEAYGQTVEIPARAMGGSFSSLNDGQIFTPRVMGIVKDFHFQSLREKIAPLVMAYQYNPVHNTDYFTARITGNDIKSTLSEMERVITSIDPEHLLEYHFLDEQLALFYIDDARRQKMLIWAALATIFIACLGLFGLATYAAEQRIKEIGVRKVLGAGVSSLVALLSKDFLKLVLIANVLAFPMAWWAGNRWLTEFAYHIDFELWYFIIAGFSAIIIALLTISYQAIKAALMNPVNSLKNE